MDRVKILHFINNPTKEIMSRKTSKNAAHAALQKEYRRVRAAYYRIREECGTFPDSWEHPVVKNAVKAQILVLSLDIKQLRRKIEQASHNPRSRLERLEDLTLLRDSLL